MSSTTFDEEGVPADDADDRLPWLESADDDYSEGPSPWRVVAMIVGGLAAIALVIWGINAFNGRHKEVAGSGALIKAPEGDYKVKPDQPGGMKVEGEGDTVFATSEGGATKGAVDTDAVPEAPVKGKAASVEAQGKATAKVVAAVPASSGQLTAQKPAIATPRSAQAGGGGSLVQLGSFPSEASASSAWGMFSKRFSYLAPLGKSIEPTEVGGRTYYRLRVNAGSAGQAAAICGKLKVAGEACFVPN